MPIINKSVKFTLLQIFTLTLFTNTSFTYTNTIKYRNIAKNPVFRTYTKSPLFDQFYGDTANDQNGDFIADSNETNQM